MRKPGPDTTVPPASSFFIFCEINSAIARDVVEWIIKVNQMQAPYPYITIIINSEGGDLSAAFAIIDTIANSVIPVHTIGMGDISSAALILFMSGHHGNRIIKPNTSILSHQFSASSEGKYSDLLGAQRDFELTNNRVIAHYMKHTKLSREKVLSLLLPHGDVFLTPAEAVKYGCADIIE